MQNLFPFIMVRRKLLQYLLLAAAILAGIVLRALYLEEAKNSPDFYYPSLDASYHDYWARGLVTGNWAVPPGREDPQIYRYPYYRPPGYAYVLALVYELFGIDYFWPRVVQMALGLVSAVAAFYLGRRWFGWVVGVIWAFLMAVYWIFIYYEAELVGESISVLLGLLLVGSLGEMTSRVDWKRGVLSGLLIGIYALFRPNIAVFIPAVAGWMIWLCRRRNRSAWGAAVAALLAGTALAIAPPLVRNYLVSGELVPIATNAGISIIVANNEITDGTTHFIPGIGDVGEPFDYPRLVRHIERQLGRPEGTLRHSEASNYLVKQALSFMRQHPGRFLYLLGRKALLFWGPREVRNLKETHYARLSSPVLRSIPLNFPLVLALAVLGALLFFTRKREGGGGKNDEIRMTLRLRPPLMGRASSGQAHDEKGSRKNAKGRVAAKAGHHSPLPTPYSPSREYEIAILLVLFIVFYFLSMLPFAAADRYRIPLIPFLLLFSACGLKRMGEFWIRGEWAAGLIWAAAGGLLFGLFSINATGYRPSPEKWHYDLALAYCDMQDWEQAIREYKEAIRYQPTFVRAYNNLGNIYALRGEYEEASRYYQLVIKLDPSLAQVQSNLGNVLYKQGRVEESICYFREALRLRPDLVEAHNNLGVALQKLGKYAEAAECYRQALVFRPHDVASLVNLGNLLIRQGKYAEAVEELELALRLQPDLASARKSLEAARRGLASPGQPPR